MKTRTTKTTRNLLGDLRATIAFAESQIKDLQAENSRLSDVLTAIKTRHSRLLLYDNLTLPKARQIGENIDALISFAFGDLTKAQLRKKVKHLSGFGSNGTSNNLGRPRNFNGANR